MQKNQKKNNRIHNLIIIIINCKTYEKKLVKPVQNKRRLILIVKQKHVEFLCLSYSIPHPKRQLKHFQ